jgi:hypothetical protein
MPHYLLTGAGFSRNWGGWLVPEVFSYLMSCDELDQASRDLLIKHRKTGGFENALTQLQTVFDASPTMENSRRLQSLQSALHGMFETMSKNFASREFEFQPDVAYQVAPFLGRFDAIFTTNQDTLLEAHYTGGHIGQHWPNIQTPGMKWAPGPDRVFTAMEGRLLNRMPDDQYAVAPNAQPYFKLHGSINWRANGHVGRMIIMGGDKEAQIKRYPVLRKYREEFETRLSQSGARLMVIGYGFNDQHINNAIGRAVEKGLKVFIVDPYGIDVFDKTDRTGSIPGPTLRYTELLQSAVIGESTRPLTSTFGADHAEHAAIMRFFK